MQMLAGQQLIPLQSAQLPHLAEASGWLLPSPWEDLCEHMSDPALSVFIQTGNNFEIIQQLSLAITCSTEISKLVILLVCLFSASQLNALNCATYSSPLSLEEFNSLVAFSLHSASYPWVNLFIHHLPGEC